MTITHIQGEPSRFHVQSDSQLQCCSCPHTFGWPRKNRQPKPLAECACPKCGGASEPVIYLVDTSAYFGAGWCACQDFQCRVQSEFNAGKFEARLCKHLILAFFLVGQRTQRELFGRKSA